jgi:probable phosphoglycerate mutase
MQTAEPIGTILSTRVEPVFDLREMSCGVAEGKPRSWLDARLTPPPRHGNRLDHQICEGAETRRSAATRVSRFVTTLLQESDDTSIVVTHGVVFTYLLTTWLGMPPESVDRARFSASAASITTLQIDPVWDDRILVLLNETAHLHA